MTLRNTGRYVISIDDGDNFSLRFCNIRKIFTEYAEEVKLGEPDIDTGSGVSEVQRPSDANTTESSLNRIKVELLNGCAHQLTVLDGFTLDPGTQSSFTLVSQYWMVARTDVMPNWLE